MLTCKAKTFALYTVVLKAWQYHIYHFFWQGLVAVEKDSVINHCKLRQALIEIRTSHTGRTVTEICFSQFLRGCSAVLHSNLAEVDQLNDANMKRKYHIFFIPKIRVCHDFARNARLVFMRIVLHHISH